MKKIVWFLFALMLFSAIALAADIEMQSVESSLIAKIGYDAEAKTLAIQMNNSSDIYLYEAVPQSVFDDFLSADSKGAYFVNAIKGKFSRDKEE